MNVAAAELPDLPSELLSLGIQTLQRHALDSYVRKMQLGNLVAEHVLGVLPREFCSLARQTNRKLLALDAFQRGKIRQAFAYLDLPWLSVNDWIDVTPYHHSPTLFQRDLEKIVHALHIRGY
jgi:hypothetical protein